MAKLKLQKIREYDWRKLFFELIVVFLGVTAGFLLNNWQLEKQDQRLEKKYIAGFHQDAISNIAELEQLIVDDSLWLDQVKSKLVSIQASEISPDSANAVLIRIVSISKVDLQTSTYEDITNSGKLNIISDYNIRQQIVDYHVALAGVKFIDDYFLKYFSDFVMPFIYNHFSVLNGRLVDPEMRKTTQFENVVAGYFSMVQQRKLAYEKLLEKSNTLKSELQKIVERKIWDL